MGVMLSVFSLLVSGEGGSVPIHQLSCLCLVVCCLSTLAPTPVLPHLSLTTVECVFECWAGEGGSVPIHQSTVCVGDHSLKNCLASTTATLYYVAAILNCIYMHYVGTLL